MEHDQVQTNIACWRRMIKAAQECDYDTFKECATDSYICHGPGKDIDEEPKVKTEEEEAATRKAFENCFSSFSEMHFTNEMFGSGDRVANYWVCEGLHDGGPYRGVAPSGNRVRFSGIAIGRFEDGKLAEEWEYWDEITMYQQLGAIPKDATTLLPSDWEKSE